MGHKEAQFFLSKWELLLRVTWLRKTIEQKMLISVTKRDEK